MLMVATMTSVTILGQGLDHKIPIVKIMAITITKNGTGNASAMLLLITLFMRTLKPEQIFLPQDNPELQVFVEIPSAPYV